MNIGYLLEYTEVLCHLEERGQTNWVSNRIPFKAYRILYHLDERRITNSVSNVRYFSSSFGARYVWDSLGVGHIVDFLKVFRQKLIDCRWQYLDDHIKTSERFSFHEKFKTSYEIEPSLMLDTNRYVKRSLRRFRFEISDIFVHCMRYRSNVTAREMMCPFCTVSVKNEVHFLLCCTGLDDIRSRYIHPKYFNFASDFRLTLLLSTNE